MALGTASADDVAEYVTRYKRAGFIKEVGFYTAQRRFFYRVTNSFPADAPKLKRDGKPATHKQVYQQIWVAVRKLKKFTLAELIASVDGIPKNTIQTFLQNLKQSGLVELNGKWVLKRDIGPLAPQKVNGKFSYDPNNDKEIS